MQIGDRIRFFRINQNINQEELANGIISVSYLSKIENNQVLPSIEVIELLCKRLGIKFIDYEEPNLKQKLFDWYKSIVDKNAEKAEELYKKFEEEMKNIQDSLPLMYYMLFKLRYCLMVLDLESAKKYVEQTNELLDILTEDMRYYYYKFMGLYQYLRENYQDAFDYYKKSEKILYSVIFEKWEEADLFYAVALTGSRLWKVPICINYAQKALEIYQSNYNYRRSAECQMLLGISFARIGEYEKALESYNLGNKIADTLGNDSLKGKFEHNLGTLFSYQKNGREAIPHYLKSLHYKENELTNSKLYTTLAIVKEYELIEDYEQGLKWVEEGLNIAKTHPECYEYELHFKVYRYLMISDNSGFESFMKEDVLPYFEEKEDFDVLAEYSEFLAVYYEKLFKYKYATKYYAISNSALKKIIN